MSSNIQQIKADLISKISLLAIFITAILFVIKYSEIYLSNIIIPTLIYTGIFLAAISLLFRYDFSFIKKNQLRIISLIIFLISVLFIFIIPRVGNIGRLPAIVEWIELLFNGIYPYTSDLTPSSFPMLFYIAMPFYFIGKLGFLEVIGLGVFLFLSFRYLNSPKQIAFALILLLITPMIYYEFAVRCELFFNISLVMVAIFAADKYLDVEKVNAQFFLIAVLFGLFLSTRSVVAVVYGVYLIYRFKHNIKNLIFFGVIVLAVFILILLPYIIWDFYLFIDIGPFAIQSKLSNLPFWITVMFLIVSLIAGWAIENKREVFFFAGLLIWLMVMVSYIIKVFNFGLEQAFIQDKIDLSYLIFSLPLLIFSASMQKEYSNADDMGLTDFH